MIIRDKSNNKVFVCVASRQPKFERDYFIVRLQKLNTEAKEYLFPFMGSASPPFFDAGAQWQDGLLEDVCLGEVFNW